MKSIQISANYRIINKDKLNWDIEERSIVPDLYLTGKNRGKHNPKAGQEKWVCLGHHTTLKNACLRLMEFMQQAEEEFDSVQGIVDQIERSAAAIIKGIEGIEGWT
jgi:hypothetical protein